MNTRWKSRIIAVVIVLCVSVLAGYLSYQRARSKSEAGMERYRQWIGCEYGYWSFRGLRGNATPSWIFIYDDPLSFDGSVVRVQVSVFGRILQVQPSYSELDGRLTTLKTRPDKARIELHPSDNTEDDNPGD